MGGVSNSSGGFFNSVIGAIGSISTAASGVLGAWSGIQQRKLDIKLQNAQVQAEINNINARRAAIKAASAQAAPVARPVSFQAPAASGSFSLATIPPWMLVAGAFVALFTLKGVIK